MPHTIPPISVYPNPAFELLRDDYLESVRDPKFPEEYKKELLNSIGRFVVASHDGHNPLTIDYVATELDMSTEGLLTELEEDEFLAEAFNREVSKGLNPEAKARQKYYETDTSEFGWISGEEKLRLPTRKIETPELTYRFVDLVGLHRTPRKLRQKLEDQGELDGLMEKLLQESIPLAYHKALHGDTNQRQIAIKGRSTRDVTAEHSFNCTKSSYKFDVHGTSNRAIVVFLGKNDEGVEQFGLAALYDHDDDRDIHNTMFLKQK